MFDTTNFPKAKKIWHMGQIHDWSIPKVHSMTHALHYGTSVFEGIRAYATPKGPAIFRLDEHIDRFFHSADVLKMEVPYSRQEIIDAIKLVMKENQLESAYIRPMMFYSYGNLGLIPKSCPVELVISCWEWGAYLGEASLNGVHVYILPWKRVHHSQYHMGAKLGGIYVQSTFCGIEAREKGYDEGVFLNIEGNIAEGPGENILLVQDGTLKTNDRSESILEGITRTSILQIATDLGIPTTVEPITKEDFFHANEALFTGTAVEVVPITKVTDGSDPYQGEKEYSIDNGEVGPITTELRKTYLEIVNGKRTEYENWLTYVNS